MVKNNSRQVTKNLWSISLLVVVLSVFYWQLNRLGYLPPINYFLASNNSTDSTLVTSDLNLQLLNYDLSLAEIVSGSIDILFTMEVF